MEQEHIDTGKDSRGYKLIYTLIKKYIDHPHSAATEAKLQQWMVSDRHWELKKMALNDLLFEMKYENTSKDEVKNTNLVFSHSWVLYIQAKEERIKTASGTLNND